jgi:hypothetical protein
MSKKRSIVQFINVTLEHEIAINDIIYQQQRTESSMTISQSDSVVVRKSKVCQRISIADKFCEEMVVVNGKQGYKHETNLEASQLAHFKESWAQDWHPIL